MKLKIRNDNIFYHIHIPKCGGTTLTGILKDHFGKSSTLDGMSPLWEDFLLNKLEFHQLQQIKAVSGHVVYRVHNRCIGTPIYVALVRAPIERCISAIKFIRNDAEHYLYPEIVGKNLDDSFEKLLQLGEYRLIGRQCEFICSSNNFEIAKKTIEEKYFLVAPLERFDDFIKIISAFILRKHVIYPIKNKNYDSKTDDYLSDSNINIIYDIASEDFKLLEYVRDSFEEQWGFFLDNFRYPDFDESLKT